MQRRIPHSPEDRVQLDLSPEEHVLLTTRISLPEALRPRLRVAVVKGGGYTVSLTLHELIELSECAVSAAHRTRDPELENSLIRTIERIQGILRAHTDADPANGLESFLSALPPEAAGKIRQILEREEQSLENVEKEIGEVISELNAAPRKDLGGLSPSQLHSLLTCDWVDPSGPMYVSESLCLQDLEPIPLFVNARIFLSAVESRSGVKCTSAGNLPRAFVSEMLERFVLADGYRASIRLSLKVVNEEDLTPLHLLRILLDLAGAIRKSRGKLVITRAGRSLLKNENAGKLWAFLFRTMFRRLNLAYLDQLPEIPGMQQAVAYTFYQLHRYADDWKLSQQLAGMAFLEPMTEGIHLEPLVGLLDLPFQSRIVRPLVIFGLVEEREVLDGRRNRPVLEIRKTRLFDRFLRFSIPER